MKQIGCFLLLSLSNLRWRKSNFSESLTALSNATMLYLTTIDEAQVGDSNQKESIPELIIGLDVAIIFDCLFLKYL